MSKKKPVISLSRESMEARVSGGRTMLLTAIILTVVNIVIAVLDAGAQFLYSISVPYYLVSFGKGMDNGFAEGKWSVTGTYTISALVIAAVILGVYLLCWYLSKKRRGWLIVGLVLFIVDTLALVYISLTLLMQPGSNVIDLCIHLWMIFLLVQAVRNSKKLKLLDQEEAFAQAEAEKEKKTGPSFDDL